ncbi:hypothetical protein P168DRAFT_275238 [Aspergillus campestris IBT 28561]|uniref:Uncharacterized protein n=1 Tax=Aspergillus campestris (strain IBT 28561) TaxID=1392248 RepID=A0A2I1CT39_ASPC2|nr:uncharacterized protein P168DRAFT_275238 [Aspergillus campestris IBT 28561]PKY00777.1 hypothetical protein P168DRAFT_275238 [Aspergillus campestris IBT 28561]
MDPLSIIAGATGIADIFLRVVIFLKDIPDAVASVQQEIKVLITEVETLRAVLNSVQTTFDGYIENPDKLSLLKATNLEDLSSKFRSSIEACYDLATRLEKLTKEVYGKSGSTVTGKLDGLRKEFRRRDKNADLARLRMELSAEKHNLTLLLDGINLHNQNASQGTLNHIHEDVRSLKAVIVTLESRLALPKSDDPDHEQMDATRLSRIKRLQRSIRAVVTAVSTRTPNEFFDIPQPVSSYYTGRARYLEELQNILVASTADEQDPRQQRFVVYGMGGAGKTQFCCKFAEQNRESYWGIFWIDATSHERIKQTYAQIGKFGKVEANHTAAMHWLSNQEGRWLLIMDNADDPSISLDQYFPRGDRGHVIITTRNPSHKGHGNIGPGFFRFEDLSSDDANSLLLRATTMAEPWDTDSLSWAETIARQLGYLALSLIQAGSAIRNGLCTLRNYLAFHDAEWEHLRLLRRQSVGVDHAEKYSSVHATYEVCYKGIEDKGTQASKDAIQLLKLFSCFYYKKIRFDILTKAIENCKKERIQQETAAKDEQNQPVSWYETYNNLRLFLLVYLTQGRDPPILPDFIRQGRESETLDIPRIRYALRELTQMSLITHDESDDSYSMHPLIHEWASKRPAMSSAEQAVWSHAAATTLVYALLLPPLGNTEDQELFRIRVLPHVDHVRKVQEAARRNALESRKPGLFDWFWVRFTFDRAQALRDAKFSMVYLQNWRLKDAEELQTGVKDSLEAFLGPNHASTRRITLALASTYRSQSRGDEAADLQEAVLNACITSLGPDHVDTLTTMDVLGQSRWLQGRFSDAKVLQQKAVDGLLKSRGRMHEDTLTAMGYLGRTLGKFYENYDHAFQLLEDSYAGLKETLGPVHSKTLEVKEEIAMLNLQVGSNLSLASQMMQEVLEARKENMGKEHPFTLFAMASMARINIGLGRHDEAEDLLRSGLAIADRNLGEDHIGTLMGRTWLGAVLAHQSRFEESEATLLRVIEMLRNISSYRGENHPDRLSAMIQLSLCYRLQGRYDDAIQLCDRIIDGLQTISVTQHPLERKTIAEKYELLELKAAREGRGEE